MPQDITLINDILHEYLVGFGVMNLTTSKKCGGVYYIQGIYLPAHLDKIEELSFT